MALPPSSTHSQEDHDHDHDQDHDNDNDNEHDNEHDEALVSRKDVLGLMFRFVLLSGLCLLLACQCHQ